MSGIAEKVKCILNGEKLEEEHKEIEKGIRTITVLPTATRVGYQYQRNFPENKRKNHFNGKNEKIVLDRKKEVTAKNNLLSVMTESFYNFCKNNNEIVIKSKFSDNPTMPILNMPYRYMALFGKAKDSFVFSGKQSLAVHIHRHSDVSLDVFQDMQKILNNTTNVYVEKNATSPNGQKGVAFEVMNFRKERYAIVVRTDKQGKLIFWKSIHIQHNVQNKWKKINLAHLEQGVRKSEEGGQTSIYRTSNASSSDLSAFPDYTSNIPRIYNNFNKSVEINIADITEGNRFKKFEQLEKAFRGETPKYISADNTARLPNVNIRMKDYSRERVEKALRTLAFSFDIPQKAAKGEIFFYKAQENLTDKWCGFFSSLMRKTYDFLTDCFDLPKKTVMKKSELLTHQGKILYSPETGEPIKLAEWNKFVKTLELFLNRNLQDSEKKIILESTALAKILDRMTKYNTLEQVKNATLDELKYQNKSFDWISENVQNMNDIFGNSFPREEQARIKVLQMSAGQQITSINDRIRNEVKQILIDGVKNHKSKSDISQALFDKMVGDNRDFQRIADTEIQNAFNSAFVHEEVYNTPKGEKTYFKRVEVIDNNTCAKCKSLNGKIAVWSEKPQNDEISKDENADFVIWDGKDSGNCPIGTVHPYCRGVWGQYIVGIDDLDTSAYTAML